MRRKGRPSPFRYFAIAAVLAVAIYAGLTVGRLWFDPSSLQEAAATELMRLGLADNARPSDDIALTWSGGPVLQVPSLEVAVDAANATVTLRDIRAPIALAGFATGAVRVSGAEAPSGELSVILPDGSPTTISLTQTAITRTDDGWAVTTGVGPHAAPARLSLSRLDDRPLTEAAYLIGHIDGAPSTLSFDGTLAQTPEVMATLTIEASRPTALLSDHLGLSPDLLDIPGGLDRFRGQVTLEPSRLVLTGGEATVDTVELTGDLAVLPDAASGRLSVSAAALTAPDLAVWRAALQRFGTRDLDLAVTLNAVSLGAATRTVGPVVVRLAGTGAVPEARLAWPGSNDAEAPPLVLQPADDVRDADLRIPDLNPVGATGSALLALPDGPDGTINLLVDAGEVDLSLALRRIGPWQSGLGAVNAYASLHADQLYRGGGVVSDVEARATIGRENLTILVEEMRLGEGLGQLTVRRSANGTEVSAAGRTVDGAALARLVGLPDLLAGSVTFELDGTLPGGSAATASGRLTLAANAVSLAVPQPWRTLDLAAEVPDTLTVDRLRIDLRLGEQGVVIDQLSLVAEDIELDAEGTVDPATGALNLTVSLNRRTEDGLIRLGGSLHGSLQAPSLRVLQR